MPGCIVPGCTSGYKSNFEKVHFFSVPKDNELREKWQAAMRRSKTLVSKTQVVCAKHFLSKDIIRKRHLLSPEGNIIGVSPYQRPRLAVGTVPSRFPWTEVISSDDEEENIPEPNCDTVEVGESLKDCLDTREKKYCITNDPEVDDSINEVENFNFNTLLNSTVALPGSWVRIVHKGPSLISFSLLACEMTDGKWQSFNLKEVIVDANLQLHTHVLQKSLEDSSYITVKKMIANTEELEYYLKQLNDLRVCRGSMISDIITDKRDASYKDIKNVNRVEACSLLCHTLQCKLCYNAKRAFVRKRKRNEIKSKMTKSEAEKHPRIRTNLKKLM